MAVADAAIRRAIAGRLLLEFDYHGQHRIVEPYCYGVTTRGVRALRAVQLRRPNSVSGSGGFHFGKLWKLAEMENVRVSSETFAADDPDYNPNDSALVEIFCRV